MPWTSQFENDGQVVASSGAHVFVTVPVIGTGLMYDLAGSILKISGPVGAGQTVRISKSTLEFGPPGSLTQPSMQFMGTLNFIDTNPATVLLDGVYGLSDSFRSISSTGGGLSELKVFGGGHVEVADFHLTGHYSANEFSLVPVLPSAADSNQPYTAVNFTYHPPS